MPWRLWEKITLPGKTSFAYFLQSLSEIRFKFIIIQVISLKKCLEVAHVINQRYLPTYLPSSSQVCLCCSIAALNHFQI